MSYKARRILPAVVAALILAVPALFAQGGGGGAVSPRRERARDRERTAEAAPTFDQWLEKAGLTETERAAVTAALEKKRAAHRGLRPELEKLRKAADDPESTEARLRSAMTAYRAAMKRVEKEFQDADRQLAAKLSVKSQARCLAMGILDNGLGRGGGMGPRAGAGREAEGRGDSGGRRGGGARGERPPAGGA